LSGGGAPVRAQENFNEHYKPEGHSDHPQDAIRSAFNRGLKEARKKDTIGEGQRNDTDWIWP
jgi:hypothetical protein